MKKFKRATLGCRTNQYESEAYATQLRRMGYREASDGEEADLCIINTCTVTASADSHSRQQIRQLHRNNPGAKIVVTGCLAERAPEEVLAIEGVTHLVSNRDKERLLEKVFPEEAWPEFQIDQFQAHTRAFVKVQDGCNSFCTYCILPYVRGRSRSRSFQEIIEEVRGLVKNGYKEVVLTGINIGDFVGESGESLADLVKAVDGVEGLVRLRLSSIDPDEVDEALIEAILQGKTTCRSLHIVLQAGSNLTLKRMNRKYTKQMFLQTVQRLKKAASDFTFTTDVIVGFPGETESDFEETLEVMRQVRFAHVHMFPFSPRQRTKAALYPNRVPPEVMRERKQRVLRAAEQSAFELRQEYVGQRVRVLVEESGKGHSDNFLPVICDPSLKKNTMVEMECVDNRAEGLVGRVV